MDGKDVEYELFPLNGSFYGDFMEVLKAMPQGEDDKSSVFDNLTKEVINKSHLLLFHMIKNSYDVDDAEELKMLNYSISKNLLNLLPVLMEINLPKAEEPIVK